MHVHMLLFGKFPVEQFEASRVIRGSSISVSSTLPPLILGSCSGSCFLLLSLSYHARGPHGSRYIDIYINVIHTYICIYLTLYIYIDRYIYTCVSRMAQASGLKGSWTWFKLQIIRSWHREYWRWETRSRSQCTWAVIFIPIPLPRKVSTNFMLFPFSI